MSMTGRPRVLSLEKKTAAAEKLTDSLIRDCGFKLAEREEIISDIVRYAGQSMDGYELAKTLEQHCGWCCTMDIAEILDSWSSVASSQLSAMEAEWAIENAVKPNLLDGTRVVVPGGKLRVIDGVYEYGAAKYKIKLDEDASAPRPGMSWLIVNFEDAVVAPL